MKNHYSVLQISRDAKNSEIKEKCKELLQQVKKSNIPTKQKNKLSKEIFESYEFLVDYHSRKSLDDFLDSQYKIISPQAEEPVLSLFNMIPIGINFNELEKELNNTIGINSNKGNDTYFYSSSSITTNELDKNGNIITKTKQSINDNGKKEEKEFNNIYDKKDYSKKLKNKLPFLE